MRSGLALLAVVMAALARSGCGGPSSPNGSPSASPSPRARPNSAALENLPLVRRLEQGAGRRSILIFIAGFATVEGQVVPGGSWGYEFAEIQGNIVKIDQWEVFSDGRIVFHDEVPDLTGRLGLDNAVEIGPTLTVDTPEAIRRAREYGAEEFVRRFPRTEVTILYGSTAGHPVCRLLFTAEPTVRCGIFILLDPRTGELLDRNLSCYETLPPP